MKTAFNIRLKDKSVHAYAQKHCFLNGPDLSLNRALRKSVLESKIELAEEQDDHRITFLDFEQQQIIVRELAGLNVPSELGLDRKTIDGWTYNLGWKVHTIPKVAKDVLIIGSASCREAIFIRHRLPGAKITCMDFEDSRIQNIERVLDIKFIKGDFNEFLAGQRGRFDVVFSNHVLEHLFDPGATLGLIRHALKDTGCLISALPLDGQPTAPFSEVLNRKALHPLDFCMVDVAHGWKTNISNLLQELRDAGFSEMNFLGRERHYSVMDLVFPNRLAFERRARLGMKLNRIFFSSARGVLKKLFPREVPLPVMKVMFGIERRFWFGSNRLKNTFSIECLVIAKV